MSKALIIATSADKLGDLDTGVWLEEVAAPFYVFKQAGWTVDLASPAGGPIPVDAASRSGDFYTVAAARFDADDETKAALVASKKVSDVDGAAYDAVFVAGGHGAVADLASDPAVGALLAAADGAGRVVAAVCHGVVALLNGEDCVSRLVRGRRLTGFSDAEEAAVGKTDAVGGPGQTLEARLKAAGGAYAAGPDWAPHVVVDGRLVTGQNPQSSAMTAAAAVKAVEQPPTPAVDAGGRKRVAHGNAGPERVDPTTLAASAPLAHPPSYHHPRRPPI